MKTVRMTICTEADVLVEVPDDWDSYEFLNRTNPEHDALLEELLDENGAYPEVMRISDWSLTEKPAPYIWDPVKKDIVHR